MTERYAPVGARQPLLRGNPKVTRRHVFFQAPPPGTPGVVPDRHGERRERGKLILYALALLALSACTEPAWLLASGVAILALGGRQAPAIARHALLATMAFSTTVSLAYVIQIVWLSGNLPWRWLAMINLRVLDMSMLTFLCIRRINLYAALAFSKRLSFLLVLAVSQSIGLRRTLDDFRLAMLSRGVLRAGLRHRYRATAHATAWLLDRALANAHDSAQALRARGVFR